eukprot:2795547-Prymnesium_polylepis.1
MVQMLFHAKAGLVELREKHSGVRLLDKIIERCKRQVSRAGKLLSRQRLAAEEEGRRERQTRREEAASERQRRAEELAGTGAGVREGPRKTGGGVRVVGGGEAAQRTCARRVPQG